VHALTSIPGAAATLAARWRSLIASDARLVRSRGAPLGFLAALLGVLSIIQPLILQEAWWILLLSLWILPRPHTWMANRTSPLFPVVIVAMGALLGWFAYVAESALRDLQSGYAASAGFKIFLASVGAGVAVLFPAWRFCKLHLIAVTLASAICYLLCVGYWAVGLPGWMIELPWGALTLACKIALPPLLLIIGGMMLRRTADRSRQEVEPELDFIDRQWEKLTGPAASMRVPGLLCIGLIAIFVQAEYDGDRRLPDLAPWRDSLCAIAGLLLLPLNLILLRRLSAATILLATLAVPVFLWGTLVNAPRAAKLVPAALARHAGDAWQVRIIDPAVMQISGEFTPGIARRTEMEMDRHPGLQRVELNSPGGDIEEGYRMARAIYTHRLSTRVDSLCASACTIAFAAGIERTLEGSGHLGFHRCTSDLWYAPCDEATAVEFKVMRARGIDPAFLDKALRVPNSTAWYPTPEELLSAHVITGRGSS
jgi:hypothetical protein